MNIKSRSKIIKIWKISSLINIRNLTGHRQSVQAVKFLKNGLLISGSLDESVKIWSMKSFLNIATKNDSLKRVNSVTRIVYL